MTNNQNTIRALELLFNDETNKEWIGHAINTMTDESNPDLIMIQTILSLPRSEQIKFLQVIKLKLETCQPAVVPTLELNGMDLITYCKTNNTSRRYTVKKAQKIIGQLQKMEYLLSANTLVSSEIANKLSINLPELLAFLTSTNNKFNASSRDKFNQSCLLLDLLKQELFTVTGLKLNALVEMEKHKTIASLPYGRSVNEELLHMLTQPLTEDNRDNRFEALVDIATILRTYRPLIKDLLGKDAQIKIRGSMIRGMKGSPKNGAPPNIDNYDFDAFIEVSNTFFNQIKKLNFQVENENFLEKIRNYEDIEKIDAAWGYEKKKSISLFADKEFQQKKEIANKINELKKIITNIKKDILVYRQQGRLLGHAMLTSDTGEVTPDFSLYLRPIASVRQTYEEKNPYPAQMLENQGYIHLANTLSTQNVSEFDANHDGKFKHPILALYKDEKAVTLPEFQVIIGTHEFYLENEQLFTWRELRKKNQLTHASPRKLSGLHTGNSFFYSSNYNKSHLCIPSGKKPHENEKNHYQQDEANTLFSVACSFPIVS